MTDTTTSVAIARARSVRRGLQADASAAVLTDGDQLAFGAAATFALFGLISRLLLTGDQRARQRRPRLTDR